MMVYWLMFAPLAFIALNERERRHLTARTLGLSGIAAVIMFIVLIGYRFETGGDWFNYMWHFTLFRKLSLWDNIDKGVDPGYGLFINLSESLGWGFVGVNVLSAA